MTSSLYVHARPVPAANSRLHFLARSSLCASLVSSVTTSGFRPPPKVTYLPLFWPIQPAGPQPTNPRPCLARSPASVLPSTSLPAAGPFTYAPSVSLALPTSHCTCICVRLISCPHMPHQRTHARPALHTKYGVGTCLDLCILWGCTIETWVATDRRFPVHQR